MGGNSDRRCHCAARPASNQVDEKIGVVDSAGHDALSCKGVGLQDSGKQASEANKLAITLG